MFELENNNKKIGQYLNDLIVEKYVKVRRFCIDYLKVTGQDYKDDAKIARLQNRMTQIIRGNKGIQIYDLPVFCELLGVSCEEIITAGKHYEPISGHVTNYEVAFSDDPEVWEKHVNRPDKLFLNTDEYNKTILDYAFEFKNYKFLCYLLDKGYIWFVDESESSYIDRAFYFSAGTSIERRPYCDVLDSKLFNNDLKSNGLRGEMIKLAVENEDDYLLKKLHANETQALYEIAFRLFLNPENIDMYYDDDLIEMVSKAGNTIIKYYSQEIIIKDNWGGEHTFVYQYLSELIERMIKNKNKYTESVLKRALKHNKDIYIKYQEALDAAYVGLCERFNSPVFEYSYENICEMIKGDTFFNEDIKCFIFRTKFIDGKKVGSNIVKINATSDDMIISDLINEINEYYGKIRDIKPNVVENKEAL